MSDGQRLSDGDQQVWGGGDFLDILENCLTRLWRENPPVEDVVMEGGRATEGPIPEKIRRPVQDVADWLSECLGHGTDVGIYPSSRTTNQCFPRHIVLCDSGNFLPRAVGIEGIVASCLARGSKSLGVMFVDISHPASKAALTFGTGKGSKDVVDTLRGLQVRSVLFKGHAPVVYSGRRWVKV
jgi:hypothetical protein